MSRDREPALSRAISLGPPATSPVDGESQRRQPEHREVEAFALRSTTGRSYREAVREDMASWTQTQRDALSRLTAPRSRREEVEADLEHERGLSPEQKDVRIQGVLHLAWETLRTRPDRARVVAPEPPAPDFPAIWRRLVEKRRSG